MKDKRRILILGAGIMQGPVIRIAGEMGLETVVVDGDPAAPCRERADRFECIDLKDKEGIEALARGLQAEKGGLGAVITAGTDFSASVAWVAERLGLPGIPYQAALDASDKERMRRCFQEAGLPSPSFIVRRDTDPFTPPFPFPVVVKPVDNMGSRGCRRVDAREELGAAVEGALGFSRSGRVIVEEYMEGPEYSVDAVLDRGEVRICGLADRHIFFPPYFVEMGHTMPAELEGDGREALIGTFIQGIQALGIREGAAKGDLKLTRRGPMIGEIAARLSGGYMSGWTYPYSSGVEGIRGAILAALGEDVGDLSPRRHWTSAERAFISIPGRIREVRGLEEAGAVPFVRDVFCRIKGGAEVRFPENNVGKAGNVISAAPDRMRAVEAAEGAVNRILLRLDSPHPATDSFLQTPLRDSFPPNAFTADSALLSVLEGIPEDRPPASAPNQAPSGASFFYIYPFPELLSRNLRDYTGRTVGESLEAVRALTGLPLPIRASPEPGRLGRAFWAALIRGGYQGGTYAVDRLSH
jgi:biotin carboxylase